ncbi:MAG: sulfite exporter TauE/SafE family protein [Maribacter sp.]|nr:sulfite exporter TauE/SafE family protein [Maribacter sp.]
MLLSIENLIFLCIGFFVIATLYSSVGFGGGSSYLAFLTLFLVSFFTIRSLALVCNLVVVSGSTYLYFKHGHSRFKDFLPFIVTSVPMAFLGATFRLKEEVFFIILGAALIISSIFLIWQTAGIKLTEPTKTYPRYLSYLIGGTIGLLSGLVGIGGGIFLAPVLNHINWDSSVKIAALASFFILVNSISGLSGLILAGTLELPWIETLVLGITVLIGGQLGVRLSLKKFSAKGIKRITAILVFVVGVRVLLVNGINIL